MPNLILTQVGWQGRVRDKVGVGVAHLPDSAIEQPDVIGVAEANIIEIIPDYASLTGSARVWLEAAVVCECAAILCGQMEARLPARQGGPHTDIQLNVDWQKRKADLEAQRDSHLARLLGVAFPVGIGVAGPQR